MVLILAKVEFLISLRFKYFCFVPPWLLSKVLLLLVDLYPLFMDLSRFGLLALKLDLGKPKVESSFWAKWGLHPIHTLPPWLA